MEMSRCYYTGGAFAAIRADSLRRSVLLSSHWAKGGSLSSLYILSCFFPKLPCSLPVCVLALPLLRAVHTSSCCCLEAEA